MLFLEKEDDSLVFRENGETVMVTPWGSDSLRVRASFLGDIADDSAALLPQAIDQHFQPVRVEAVGITGEPGDQGLARHRGTGTGRQRHQHLAFGLIERHRGAARSQQ